MPHHLRLIRLLCAGKKFSSAPSRYISLMFLQMLCPAVYAQLSNGSGINAADTYVVYDLTLSSTGTVQLPQPIYSTTAHANVTTMTAALKRSKYHVEVGFDTLDQLVMNVTPTDPLDDPTEPATDNISKIMIRSNKIILVDGAGNNLPLTVPSSLVMPQLLYTLGLPSLHSITSVVVSSNPQVTANSIGGSMTLSGSGASQVATITTPPTGSGEVRTMSYYPSGTGWQMRQLTITHTPSALGPLNSSVTLANITANTNATGDVRRAAHSAPAPAQTGPGTMTTGPLPGVQYSVGAVATPTFGSTLGQPLVLVHGLGGSSGSWNGRMTPWLKADLTLGKVYVPSLTASDPLQNETNQLVSGLVAQAQPVSIAIGHSQGGLIARRLAQQRPDLANGVITVDAPHQGAPFALTGQFALAYGVYAGVNSLLNVAGCVTILDAPACSLGALIASGAAVYYFDTTHGDIVDLVPGSSFLNTLNSAGDHVPRISIESHSNKRWVLVRLIGDAICNPEDFCGGRADYDYTQFVYYFNVARAVVDIFTIFFDPFAIEDLIRAIETILAMDAIDELWDIGTGAIGDSSDGIVPGSSQVMPAATARLVIGGADSHTGNLKSNYVRAALDNVLEHQFAVPLLGCSYTITSPAVQSVPFYGGNISVTMSTGANCVWTANSIQPFVSGTSIVTGPQTITLHVDMNLSPSARSTTVLAEGQQFTVNQAALPANAAIAYAIVEGQERYIPLTGNGPPHSRSGGGYWDGGTLSLTVNGSNYSTRYSQTSTLLTLTTALASSINNAGVNYKAGTIGGNLYVATTSTSPTANTDYSFTATSTTLFPEMGSPSFDAETSGSLMQGNP